MAVEDYGYLSSLSAHPNRAGDTSYLNPAFAGPLANAIRQARAEGLNVGLESGFRAPGQTGSAYDAGGNSSHSYGLASDISGLDGPNGKVTQRWAQIAEANGLHNPYGVGNRAEFNHWQLPEQPLEKNPQLLASLKQASATGDTRNVWNAYNGSNAVASNPLVAATAASNGASSRPVTPTPGPTLFTGVNSDARGMRNNNPGNLVDNGWTQSLPGYKGSDGKFAIFDTPENGAMALDRNLQHYGSTGFNTPSSIAAHWAPTQDNNDPKSYGEQIARALGIGPNDKIDMSDQATRSKITNAIGMVENGPGQFGGLKTTQSMFANASSSAAPTAVASNAAPTAVAANAATSGMPTSVGDALTRLTTEDAKGETPLDKLGAAFKPKEAPKVDAAPMQAPQDQSAMLAPAAQQLLSQTMAAFARPLSWSSSPYGSGTAGQQPPGLTLTGNPYNG